MIYTDGTHMIADTDDELHAFANAIGAQDYRDTFSPHYQLATSEYRKALTRGAQLITAHDLLGKVREIQSTIGANKFSSH